MNDSGNKSLTIILSVACVGLLVLSGVLFWHYEWLTIRVYFADEQIQIFDDMRTQALQSEPAGAAGCLQYVVQYYPSGTKQEAGSRLDRIVERERARAVREIVTYLRDKTGEDLGEIPEAWIHKFGMR